MLPVTSLLLIVLISLFKLGSTQSNGVLYPYGSAVGDNLTPRKIDGNSGEIPISIEYKFFGHPIGSLKVDNSRGILFSTGIISPFLADVDITLGGNVWYRQSTDPDLLHKISQDMAEHLQNLHFEATWALVATWDKIAYYGSISQKVNTFQAVLTSDGSHCFAIFNYGDIQWTTGTSGGGDPKTGLGGIPAVAGYDGRDVTPYRIPGSKTNEILNIASTSNVNYTGRWVFQVDGGCTFQATFVKDGEYFWTEGTCNRKCTCNGGKVTCIQEACPETTTCAASGSFFTCKTPDLPTTPTPDLPTTPTPDLPTTPTPDLPTTPTPDHPTTPTPDLPTTPTPDPEDPECNASDLS